MATKDNQKTDQELLAILDEGSSWLIRAISNSQFLALPATNLKSAITMAFEQSMAGNQLQCIAKISNDEIIVHNDQIYRLWQHFRFVNAIDDKIVGTSVRP